MTQMPSGWAAKAGKSTNDGNNCGFSAQYKGARDVHAKAARRKESCFIFATLCGGHGCDSPDSAAGAACAMRDSSSRVYLWRT